LSSTSASTSEKKRPVVWMIVAGVAILAAIGLGIWALKVNSDLNETQADLEAQQAATLQAQAEVQAQADAANAAAAELEKISSDNEVFVVSNEDVAQAQSDVAAAEQAVAEASANVSAAQDHVATLSAEREQARAQRDLARAERQQARICSRGSLGVLSKLGKGEADAASSELETVSSACAASVSG
jgi:uncharacterized protein (DUF3084 family)